MVTREKLVHQRRVIMSLPQGQTSQCKSVRWFVYVDLWCVDLSMLRLYMTRLRRACARSRVCYVITCGVDNTE